MMTLRFQALRDAPRRPHGLPTLMAIAVTAFLAACSDTATQPAPNPEPPPDTATYDLVFEESLFPLNASALRIRRKGESQHAPLFGQELLGIEPSIAADGRTVVFQGYGTTLEDQSDLYVVRAASAPTRIPLPIGDIEYAPALSPDGTQLAYIRQGEDGNTQLWIAALDGTGRRMLSTVVPTVATANGTPDWSPDGTRIAWATGAPGAMRIAVIRIDGSGLQTVSAGVTGGSDIDVDWSPDGKRLAYVRTPNPATSDLVVLTLATGAERVFGYSRRNRQPVWSPDGATIVFTSTMDQLDNSWELYQVKLDGTSLTRLTNDATNQRHPVFMKR